MDSQHMPLCLTSLCCCVCEIHPPTVSSFAFCGLQDYFMMESHFVHNHFSPDNMACFQVLPVTTNDGESFSLLISKTYLFDHYFFFLLV